MTVVIIGIVVLGLGACEQRKTVQGLYQEATQGFTKLPEISASQAARELSQYLVVDARSYQEYEVSRIPGAIHHAEFMQKINSYKNRKVLVYCTIGYRSGKLVEQLKKKNWDAYNLQGSLLGWVEKKQKIVDGQNNATKRVHTFGAKWSVLPKGYEAVY